MRYGVELSAEAQKQLLRFSREVRERIERALDEMAGNDDSQWSNVKALQGARWRGRFRKRVGPYRIIFMKIPARGVVEVSAILIRSEGTYR